MAVALETFVKNLEDSGIISPSKLGNFLPPKAAPKNAEDLARELVKQKHLTRFQAQEIYQGRVKGLILGNYTLLDKIGAGGMGEVYKAKHRRMDRTVAIKMLPKSVTKDAAAVARFEREVKAAAKLRHPNIVATDDADEANGVHFLVMEYIEGSDLSALVKKNGPFPVAKAVNYILQAAKGLEFAHKKGVVHRDIKPANLLLDTEGTVKILDMGLARIDAAEGPAQAELTGTGMVMGTVDYMAPEQALSTRHADARADIYSLGCTLFYLVAGKAMYGGDTLMAKLIAHREDPIPSLRDVLPEVSAPLEALFNKMLAKKVEQRYQSMTEVVADLERLSTTSVSGQDTSFSIQQSLAEAPDSKLMTFLREMPAPTPHKGKPAKKSPPLWPGNDKRKLILGAAGLAILGVAILAGVIIKLNTNDGMLVVEVDQPDAVVQVLDEQGKVEISQRGEKGTITIGVDPGKHRLQVEKDGFQFFAQDFTMESGGKTSIKAKLVPIKIAGTPAPKTTATQQATASKRANASQTIPSGKKKAPLSAGAAPTGPGPAPAVPPFSAAKAKALQANWAKHLGTTVETTNSVGAKMLLIPPGEFLMGSTDEQVEAALKVAIEADGEVISRIETAERPQHKVAITKPVLMSATEVTIGQFRMFVEATTYITEAEQYGFGDSAEKVLTDKISDAQKQKNWRTPGYAVADDSPVAQITWNDAAAYCKWLSDQEKITYRLPTEAEWEYACRAGSTTQYSFGDDYTKLEQFGWYNKNAGNQSHPVGTKLPNGFGLFDMHGNLYEWCQDFYDEKWYEKSSPDDDPNGPVSGSSRVIRGGSWNLYASTCRSASRLNLKPSLRNNHFGFRCVQELDVPPVTATPVTPAVPPAIVKPPPVVIGPQPPPAVAPFDAVQAKVHQAVWAKHLGTTVETTNSVGAKMVLIPPGEFLMGSTDEQVAAAVKVAEENNDDQGTPDRIQKAERPQHRVVLTKPFWMGATEVTIGQFKKFSASGYKTEAEIAAKATPSPPQRIRTYTDFGDADDFPAAYISWNDAVAYCRWLSEQEKTTYRLPTEAEWEYACRAGTTTQYSFGDDVNLLDQFAWYIKNAGNKSQPAGTKLPNAFGLHDMHGNLFEWCQDFYDDKWYEKSPSDDPNGPSAGNPVIRGGYCLTHASSCRSAFRYYRPANSHYLYGFRCVRVLDVPPVTASAVTPPLPAPAIVKPPAVVIGPQPSPAVAPFDAVQAKVHQATWAKHLGTTVETTNSVGAKMVVIPPGEFLMGSTDEQVVAALKVADEIKAAQAIKDHIRTNERPQHRVVITKPFWMGATEVTIGQFKKFSSTGYQTEAERAEAAAKAAPPADTGQPRPRPIETYLNPGYAVTDDSPAAAITWNDATAYCQWLSTQEKTTYRLPMEAEWEYACRAGTTTQYSFGDDVALLDQYGWSTKTHDGKSHPVGTKLPNGFGLFDMHGSVYEWCQDWYNDTWYEECPSNDPTGPVSGSSRVLRGGSWILYASDCRSASRLYVTPSSRNATYGFRCVRVW